MSDRPTQQWPVGLPATDPNGTDGTEDRIDVGNAAERDRVPDPTDAAISKIRRAV